MRVLFSAMDAAMAFPPSEPRPLEEASSYVPQVNRESKDKGKGKGKSEKVDKNAICW